MQCPQCQFEWSPPPAQCPNCNAVTLAPTQQKSSAEKSRTISKIRHWSPVGSILWGLFNIGFGVSSVSDNPLNIILVLLGIIQLAIGISLVATRPTKGGIIVEGFAFLLVGVWNISITISNSSHNSGSLIFLVLGICQLYWGGQLIFDSRQIGKLEAKKLNATTLTPEINSSVQPDAVTTMQDEKYSLHWKVRLALWLMCVVFLLAGLLFVIGSVAASKGKSHDDVTLLLCAILGMGSFSGSIATAYISISSQIPSWVSEKQQKEFERLFNNPGKFLLLVIVLSIPLLLVIAGALALLNS